MSAAHKNGNKSFSENCSLMASLSKRTLICNTSIRSVCVHYERSGKGKYRNSNPFGVYLPHANLLLPESQFLIGLRMNKIILFVYSAVP